jgi:transposase-like protein
LSIKDISDHLNETHGYHPSKHVVFNWVGKFTEKAILYFENFKPETGTTWIADEATINFGKRQKAWLWAIIDARTRFILSTRVSTTKSQHDAQLLMDSAFQKAGILPKVVITTKLVSFLDSVKLPPGIITERCDASPLDVRSSDSINQRCHGTLRDKSRKMRGFRDIKAAEKFTDGFRTYYNFLRGHELLDGKTPAESANIQYDVKEWAGLIKSLSKKSKKVSPGCSHLFQGLEQVNRPQGSESPMQILSHYPVHTKIAYRNHTLPATTTSVLRQPHSDRN